MANVDLVAEGAYAVVHAGTRMLESGQKLERVHSHLMTLLGPFVTERHTAAATGT